MRHKQITPALHPQLHTTAHMRIVLLDYLLYTLDIPAQYSDRGGYLLLEYRNLKISLIKVYIMRKTIKKVPVTTKRLQSSTYRVNLIKRVKIKERVKLNIKFFLFILLFMNFPIYRIS